MKAVRRVMAVTLVATALCADRAMASPCTLPTPQPTGTLVGRLTTSFRRVVAAVRLIETRQENDRPTIIKLTAHVPFVPPAPLAPFQFRLPPPLA
jgi:hypothetical protein